MSDLLDAMEFDFTIRDSDPDDVPHQVEGDWCEVGDSDSTATLWSGEDEPPVGGGEISSEVHPRPIQKCVEI